MKFLELSACALLTFGLVGCGRAAAPTHAASPDSMGVEDATLASHVQRIAEQLDEPLVNPYRAMAELGPRGREPGDFVVYEFSGSYRSSPLKLTQRVVDKRPGMLVVDVTLEEAGHADSFRLRLRHGPGQEDELVSVARLEGSVQQPFGTEAYEALMAKTVPPVVDNDSVLGTGSETILVAGVELPCERTSYRIFTGDAEATMTTFESPRFAWGDLGGEVVGDDGTLLYRAKVVDYGTAIYDPIPLERPDAFATFQDADYAPDFEGSDLYE